MINRSGYSPKGNQRKYEYNGFFYKEDNFNGESIAEWLCSLFLEASDCPIPFISYRLHSPSISVSKTYKPRYSMLPFGEMIDMWILSDKQFNRLRSRGAHIFNYWYNKYWLRISKEQRVKFVVNMFKKFGVSERDSMIYLTYMVELDTLTLNIDRHFNNFGLMWDRDKEVYMPMFLFDNGLSLCAGAGMGSGFLGTFKNMLDLRRVKMQPFSTSVSKNRRALPEFKYRFDVKKFVYLLDSTNNIFAKAYLLQNNQYVALRRRLVNYYKIDVNGIDIHSYLKSKGY